VLDTDATLTQVEATRDLNTQGFTLFELSPSSASILLPAMGSGSTAPDEPDTDRDLLPDRWEELWFSSIAMAQTGEDPDADALSNHAEYVLGTSPTHAQSRLDFTGQSKSGKVIISFPTQPVGTIGYQSRHVSSRRD
jgi:hypothetical protein